MIYFATLALIGLACSAFRWSVMVCVAGMLALACMAILLVRGAPVLSAVPTAAATFFVVQIAYVVGGALLSFRLRRIAAKKNIQA